MKNIKIANKAIGINKAPFLIAEAGINHNGSLDQALKMIEAAKKAKVDAVKFQTYKTEELISDSKQTYTYISAGKKINESMFEMFKRYELSAESWKKIKEKCVKENIIFLSTPSSVTDLNLLLKLDVPAIKIGSDDFNNIPLLQECCKTNLPLILSSGMSGSDEIQLALEKTKALEDYPIIFMLCVSQYPTPLKDVNLDRLGNLRTKYPNLILGFSDHTIGSIASSMAVAYGARCFEKHFTLNRNDRGPDHWFSEDLVGLKNWAEAIRTSYLVIGNSSLRPTKKEEQMREIVRKSIVAFKDINKGEAITIKNICFKRPGNGLPPVAINKIVGMKAKKFIAKNEQLKLKNLDH